MVRSEGRVNGKARETTTLHRAAKETRASAGEERKAESEAMEGGEVDGCWDGGRAPPRLLWRGG